jgi:hypothetical protein
MCFLPNRRASIDQAPGPIIAKVAPRIAWHQGNQWIADTRENNPQLNNGNEHSPDWGPQTDEEKNPSASPNDVRSDQHKLRCFPQVDSMVAAFTRGPEIRRQRTVDVSGKPSFLPSTRNIPL